MRQVHKARRAEALRKKSSSSSWLLPTLRLFVLLCLSLWASATIHPVSAQVAAHVVINEVELEDVSYGADWVELYNPTSSPVDITGWTLSPEGKYHSGQFGNEVIGLLARVVLQPKGRCIVASTIPLSYPTGCLIKDKDWLQENFEVVVLRGRTEIDRTPELSDNDKDMRTWQRFPDGADNDSTADWFFAPSTQYAVNIPEVPTPGLVLAAAVMVMVLAHSTLRK